jgi:hydroxymethylglutaryl-CoA lyase
VLDQLPQKIRVVEVGPRDGLQNEKTLVSLDDKIQFIKKLIDAGLRDIEATSFVRKEKIPQMGDGSELCTALKSSQANLISLVPNLKGLEEAIKVGVKEIAVFTSTSNTFNKKNINASIDESLVKIAEVMRLAKNNNIRIRGYISTAFGCPYEGKTSVQEFIRIAQFLQSNGAYEVSIGDTIGVAHPLQVKQFIETIRQSFSLSFFSMHFHDTRGMALANILTSLELGITSFDSSAGGLGGCPYAVGALGNVATEDLIYLLHSLGIETGVDMQKLAEASVYIFSKLNREVASKYLRAYLCDESKHT